MKTLRISRILPSTQRVYSARLRLQLQGLEGLAYITLLFHGYANHTRLILKADVFLFSFELAVI